MTWLWITTVLGVISSAATIMVGVSTLTSAVRTRRKLLHQLENSVRVNRRVNLAVKHANLTFYNPRLKLSEDDLVVLKKMIADAAGELSISAKRDVLDIFTQCSDAATERYAVKIAHDVAGKAPEAHKVA